MVLINIPNPGYILYDRELNPSALQELDQPVYLASLTKALEVSSLDIVNMETYSVWVKDDYQFMMVKKRTAFTEQLISKERNLFQKASVWFRRKWRKMKYPFPK